MTKEDIRKAIQDEEVLIRIYKDNLDRYAEQLRLSREKIEAFQEMLKGKG